MARLAGAAACLVALAEFELAVGHGFMNFPRSRNKEAKDNNVFFCPHCLQSGGPGAVKARGSGIWPSNDDPGSHGLCGDPSQSAAWAPMGDQQFMIPSQEVQATFTAGSIARFEIHLTAHHRGHYEFSICDSGLDGPAMVSRGETEWDGQECLNKFKLQRATLQELQDELGICQNGSAHPSCQPLDPNHAGRFYVPPPGENSVVAGDDWDDSEGPALNIVADQHYAYYRIPASLSCSRCTLQWYWSTGNSCLYDADYEHYFQNVMLSPFVPMEWQPTAVMGNTNICSTGGTFAEEFWNCADIEVVAAGPTPPPVPAPVPAPSPMPPCEDSLPLPGSFAAYTCSTYLPAGEAMCACETIRDHCCFCQGVTPAPTPPAPTPPAPTPPAPTPPAPTPPAPTPPGSCTDMALTGAYSTYSCSTYEPLGVAYCAHLEIAAKCCFCGGLAAL